MTAVAGDFAPELRNLPAAMRERRQWLLWRFETFEGDKKPRKVPYYVNGKRRRGQQGSDDDRAQLATFEQAVEQMRIRRFDGIGFAFLPGDGLVGIDIDGAIDPTTGEVSKRCESIIAACASYTELSPSGRGVHIIVEGATGTFRNTAVGVEVFSGRQFFTCTGRRWPGTPDHVAPISESTIRRLRTTVRGGRDKPAAHGPAAGREALDGLAERLQSAMRALSPDMVYNDWRDVGMACKAALGEAGFRLWDDWSSRGTKYPGTDALRRKWDSFRGSGVTEATVFGMAKAAGWKASSRPALRQVAHTAQVSAPDPHDGPAANDRRMVRGLDVVEASELRIDDREFDDELVESVVGRRSMAVQYGDSNVGKSFLACDLAASIVTAAPWFGRRTTGGMVIYLATEAPGSVENRVAAIRRERGATLDGLFIVRSPINLFRDAADVLAIQQLIEDKEQAHGRKVELVICDTLASIAAGANENAGEDMAIVMERADSLRRSASTSVLWVAHCGKDATRGMRGWSGVRASVDTEIELKADEATGVRSVEITKQRDLPGKGTRFGFRLETRVIGVNRWGAERTTCIVVPAEAPARPDTGTTQARRTSEVAGAIDEFLRAHGAGMRKGEIVKHFDGRHDKSVVYREIRRMTQDGRLIEAAGMVAVARRSPEGAGQ